MSELGTDEIALGFRPAGGLVQFIYDNVVRDPYGYEGPITRHDLEAEQEETE